MLWLEFCHTFIVESTKYVESIIGKESLVIKSIGEQLSHCRAAHLLVVLMLIDLQKNMQSREFNYSYEKPGIILF